VHLPANQFVAVEAAGVWTLQTGIFPENVASLALHQRAGFRVLGRRDRVGNHDGTWRVSGAGGGPPG
jgi:L-amino acid N-acyltransferase YncA